MPEDEAFAAALEPAPRTGPARHRGAAGGGGGAPRPRHGGGTAPPRSPRRPREGPGPPSRDALGRGGRASRAAPRAARPPGHGRIPALAAPPAHLASRRRPLGGGHGRWSPVGSRGWIPGRPRAPLRSGLAGERQRALRPRSRRPRDRGRRGGGGRRRSRRGRGAGSVLPAALLSWPSAPSGEVRSARPLTCSPSGRSRASSAATSRRSVAVSKGWCWGRRRGWAMPRRHLGPKAGWRHLAAGRGDARCS